MRHALESFIRRRFFVVHLGLLAIAAILTARTVTVVAGHVVAEKLKERAAGTKVLARPATGRSSGVNRDFVAAANANIFEGKREVLTPVAAPVDTTPVVVDGTECELAPRTSLRLRLVGTVVFSDQESSLASIVDESKGSVPAELFSVNDCVDLGLDPEDPDFKRAPKPKPCNKIGESATVKIIEPHRVCIVNETDHRLESIVIAEKEGERPPLVASSTPKAEEKPADAGDADIRKVGENRYEVGQGEVDKALNNLAELSTQARIVPAFEGGKTVGFKLFSIRPGSLYSKIGLQNGDVINRINGYEMSSPEKGLEIYTKLKDSKTVTVDLKRRGKPMTLDYAITP